MKYTMHCPVEGCGHVMEAEGKTKEEAVEPLMKAGNDHFLKVGHDMDDSKTREEQKQLTLEHMQGKEEKKISNNMGA